MRLFTTFILILCLSSLVKGQDVLSENNLDSLANVDVSTIATDTLISKTNSIDTVLLRQWVLVGADKNNIKISAQALNEEKEFYALFKVNGQEMYIPFVNGEGAIPHTGNWKGELFQVQAIQNELVDGAPKGKKKTELVHVKERVGEDTRVQHIPLWLSLLPPLCAIILALLTKEVILSLFIGVLGGAWVAAGMPLTPYDLFRSIVSVLDTYILNALTKPTHMSVIVFSMVIGGVVAIISKNGGMAGIVIKLSRFAKGPISTQVVTMMVATAIFFDDYANCLIVGNTMRPLTDKYRVSRQKLAYLVDSTSAPMASVAFITTWIGAELAYIGSVLPSLEGMTQHQSAYGVFLQSLSYAFYSIFTLIFVGFMIGLNRDFGPMYKAEERARLTGDVTGVVEDEGETTDMSEFEPEKGVPLRWINGVVPVAVIVLGTLLGLLDTGFAASYESLLAKGVTLSTNTWGEIWSNLWYFTLNEEQMEVALQNAASLGELQNVSALRRVGVIIGNADSYSALLWASLLAALISIVMTVVQKIQKFSKVIETMVGGFKTMLPALLILIFAWALAQTTDELGTAQFLTQLLDGNVSPYVMPAIIFVLSGAIAFSTGSSWSTMAILYPIAMPMTWTICLNAGMTEAEALPIFYNVVATVLSASVFGDHCSPISDTSILSSLSSSCNHLSHIKTQSPYAIFIAILSIIISLLSTFMATPFILNLLLGAIVIFLVLRFVGKKVPDIPVE